MSLWLIRAGDHGQHEQIFLSKSRVYVTWDGLDHDLSALGNKQALRSLLQQTYPGFGEKKIINYTGQIWPFVTEMKLGDWIVVPSKPKSAVHIAEVIGPYVFDPAAPNPYYHHRDVKWVATDVPRSNFEQDLLYSFGAFMTICEVKRNNAEKRVRAMAQTGWLPKTPDTIQPGVDETDSGVDLSELARDAIAKLMIAKLKGHGLAWLVDALLRAKGYTTYLSPPGPDKGVDILAAPEPLGFGRPRLLVQVKSQQDPVDRPTLDQLLGTMQNVQADQGLLVAWAGFKTSVHKEIPGHFFRVRLWNQKDLLDEFLQHYDKLEEEVRAELPLKRIWTVAVEEEGEVD